MPVNITPRHDVNYNHRIAFKSSKQKQNDNQKYSDPLMKWPARGLAYSNELGAAISEVAPKLGTLLWFPAMLYFGADIYDKYKNEKDSYNPSRVRGTEQAVFQFLASVILPTCAVLGGQKVTSLLGKFGKTGLTLQTEEEIIDFLQGHMSRRNIADYKDNVQGFKESFNVALANHRKKTKTEMRITGLLRSAKNYIFNSQHPEAVVFAENDNITKFSNQKIDEMFSIYNQLMTDDSKAPKEFSPSMFKKYNKIKEKFFNDKAYRDTAKADAIDMIIRKYQKSKIMNAKLLKTLGGFVALGLAIKPIDNFVEHTVMKKYVVPRLKSLESAPVDNYKSKHITKTANSSNSNNIVVDNEKA